MVLTPFALGRRGQGEEARKQGSQKAFCLELVPEKRLTLY